MIFSCHRPWLIAAIVLCAGVLALVGCSERSSVRQGAALSPDGRNVALSAQLNRQGMARGTPLLKSIDLFRQAIEADRFNASAHNNLGAALMTNGDYYNAAKEFDEAIRLLPSNPDPRVNLGLLYENVGQLRNAQHQYEQALVVSPDYLQAVQSLARVRLRLGKRDEETENLLQTIVMRSGAQWRKWAQRELSRSDLFSPAGTQPSSAATTRRSDSIWR